VYEESLSLRYKGTDTNLSISKPDDEDYGAAFGAMHLREFAFKLNLTRNSGHGSRIPIKFGQNRSMSDGTIWHISFSVPTE
jgi:hypothetical protein